MHYIIFTGGLLQQSMLVNETIANADVIIAADSGAKSAVELQVTPTVVLGDLDSLDSQTKEILTKRGSRFLISPPEKNETDTELAIIYAVTNGAKKISILGGTQGDRIDHILSNIFLAVDTPIPLFFVNGNATTWIEKGPKKVTIQGSRGDLLSLIPVTSEVSATTTTHLYYPLVGETLFLGKSRGLSNVLDRTSVSVDFATGLLLFVHIHSQK